MKHTLRVVDITLSALALIAIVMFLSSWWLPLQFQTGIDEHRQLGLVSIRGQIKLSHSTQNRPTYPDLPQLMELNHDEVDGLNRQVQSRELEDSQLLVLAPTPHREWLGTVYHVLEMPTSWFGGGTIRFVEIPYWPLVVLLGARPAFLFIRRLCAGKSSGRGI